MCVALEYPESVEATAIPERSERNTFLVEWASTFGLTDRSARNRSGRSNGYRIASQGGHVHHPLGHLAFASSRRSPDLAVQFRLGYFPSGILGLLLLVLLVMAPTRRSV